jgi:hypothetical protein
VFLKGGIGKTSVFWMAFCGGVVVFLWWGCGFWMALKRSLRKCHFWKIFLWKLGGAVDQREEQTTARATAEAKCGGLSTALLTMKP